MSLELVRAGIEWEKRLEDVYWRGAEACRARGPSKAECALAPGHAGPHKGNGFDDYGPLHRSWDNESGEKEG